MAGSDLTQCLVFFSSFMYPDLWKFDKNEKFNPIQCQPGPKVVLSFKYGHFSTIPGHVLATTWIFFRNTIQQWKIEGSEKLYFSGKTVEKIPFHCLYLKCAWLFKIGSGQCVLDKELGLTFGSPSCRTQNLPGKLSR